METFWYIVLIIFVIFLLISAGLSYAVLGYINAAHCSETDPDAQRAKTLATAYGVLTTILAILLIIFLIVVFVYESKQKKLIKAAKVRSARTPGGGKGFVFRKVTKEEVAAREAKIAKAVEEAALRPGGAGGAGAAALFGQRAGLGQPPVGPVGPVAPVVPPTNVQPVTEQTKALADIMGVKVESLKKEKKVNLEKEAEKFFGTPSKGEAPKSATQISKAEQKKLGSYTSRPAARPPSKPASKKSGGSSVTVPSALLNSGSTPTGSQVKIFNKLTASQKKVLKEQYAGNLKDYIEEQID